MLKPTICIDYANKASLATTTHTAVTKLCMSETFGSQTIT